MLDTKNILSMLEVKATATLPNNQKELEKTVEKYQKDWKEILTILWVSYGAIITDRAVRESLLSSNILPSVIEKVEDVTFKWRDDLLKPLSGEIVTYSGSQMANTVSKTINSLFKFDIANPEVVRYINTETLKLAVDLEQTVITNLNQTLTDSILNNWNQTITKDFLRGSMTVTQRDLRNIRKKYLQNVESETVRGIQELSLSPTKARQRAIRFAEKQRKILFRRKQNQRIARINRTETTRMKHFSDLNSLSQAEMTGKIKQATKTWLKSNYTDNWSSSNLNNGRTVGINDLFLRGYPTTASSLAYPSEINENCYLQYKINYNRR